MLSEGYYWNILFNMEGNVVSSGTSDSVIHRKGILNPKMASLKTFIGKSVVNISNRKLNKHEMSL